MSVYAIIHTAYACEEINWDTAPDNYKLLRFVISVQVFFFIEFARACHHIIWIRYSVIIDNVEWAPNTDRTNEQTPFTLEIELGRASQRHRIK